MADFDMSRRALGFGAVGLATLATLQKASAQMMASGGSWMDMVQQQHGMISDTFDRMLATRDGPGGERIRLLKQLGYLLTAHAVAEENVLYPALSLQGMRGDSDRLYIEQAHAKVGNAAIEMTPPTDPRWRDQVARLRDAVLHHAKAEEEGDLFPRLMRAAGPDMNARMTYKFQQQFQSVVRT